MVEKSLFEGTEIVIAVRDVKTVKRLPAAEAWVIEEQRQLLEVERELKDQKASMLAARLVDRTAKFEASPFAGWLAGGTKQCILRGREGSELVTVLTYKQMRKAGLIERFGAYNGVVHELGKKA